MYWVWAGLLLLYIWYVYTQFFSKEPYNPIDTTPKRILAVDSSGNTTSRLFTDLYIPSKTIVMWFDNEIPSGWAECNGQNGTPDLRERIPVALDRTQNARANTLGATGGLSQVKLTANQMPKHKHTGTTAPEGWSSAGQDAGGGAWNCPSPGGSHTHTFKTNEVGADQPHENLPPYYVLKFIMKL
jgi:microcystin-dependent protein